MNKAMALETLDKIKASMQKGKPTWYETASSDDKAKFDEWNAKKIEAIEYAISVIVCEDKLLRIQENAHKISELIDRVIGEEKR